MPLVLAPSFDEHTREQIEAHIAEVQARRMVAAVEYHHGQRDKLVKETDKISARISRYYELLGKEIVQMDRLIEKIEERMQMLTALNNNRALVGDMIAAHIISDENEEED